MNSDKREIALQSLELLDTMGEGITYIKQKLSELKTEETMGILSDTISGFSAVERGIESISGELGENSVKEKSEKLKRAFDILVSEYESNSGRKAYEIVQITLEPAFKNWKAEMENSLKTVMVS